jgi:BASS family bile acid:Na+ symporter
MYGIALDLKPDHFKQILRSPKNIGIGLFSQLLLLPALTFLLIGILNPAPGFALGMILVAACPGGNISNFMTHLSGGNTALSVSLTAIVTLLAVIATPLNFTLWAGLYGKGNHLLQQFSISFWEMFKSICLLVVIPLSLGMLTQHYFPVFTSRVKQAIKYLSMLIFMVFILVALLSNFDSFLKVIGVIFILVLCHNALGLLGGYTMSRIFGLNEYDRRAITIETGIQNSGLGLILIFNFFGGLGGMAVIAAWWGIWHIISGLSLALLWSRKRPTHASMSW